MLHIANRKCTLLFNFKENAWDRILQLCANSKKNKDELSSFILQLFFLNSYIFEEVNFLNFWSYLTYFSVHAFFRSSRLLACNFVKKRLQHWCFPVNTAKEQLFWRTSANGCFWFLQEFSWASRFISLVRTFTRPAFTCPNLTTEILEQGVKNVQR